MIEFILKMRNPDGSFGENRDFYRIYTTSIAMLAFYRYDRIKYKDIIRDAWYFLRESQVKEGLYEGGFGYGDRKIDKKGRMKERKYADLSNTSFVADAAYEIGIPKTDEFWKKVVIFTTRCQNLSETNRDEILLKTFKQKNYTIANDGGFFYSTNPEKAAKAGCREINGKKVINSYGSMTYTGIKIFIYAGMDKKDPRVQGAFNWIKDRYTVVEHPGFPYDPVKRHHLRGLFYYYRVFSRAFDAIGEKVIKTDRKNIEWAKDLTRVLLKLQKKQGFWQNENPSWQEGDPILSTAYVLDAYNILLKWLKK
jgi:squalene-hopene/tetraprenyl-beta-curcumene cyclase